MHIRKSAVHFSFNKGLIDRAEALEDCPEGLEDRAKALEDFKRSDLQAQRSSIFKRSDLTPRRHPTLDGRRSDRGTYTWFAF